MGLWCKRSGSTICINILILIILITVINDHLHHHHIQGNNHHHQHHCYLTQGVARGVQLEGVSRSLHGPGIIFPDPPHILSSWFRYHSSHILLHVTSRPFSHYSLSWFYFNLNPSPGVSSSRGRDDDGQRRSSGWSCRHQVLHPRPCQAFCIDPFVDRERVLML